MDDDDDDDDGQEAASHAPSAAPAPAPSVPGPSGEAKVDGAAEARTLRERYETVLRSGRDADALAAEMPPDAEEVFRRIAGVTLETVGDARARAQRLAGA